MFVAREEGQGLVEYALILVLVAIVVIGGITAFGQDVQRLYDLVTAMNVW
jgi:pilus assembly protein Flp/PilA